MKPLFNYIAKQLSAHFNQSIEIQNQTQVFGGDINQTFHLKTNIGNFFLKLNNGSLNDMFEKEFDGLQLLHQTKTIKISEPFLYGAYFENVIHANEEVSEKNKKIFLLTEYIQKCNQSKNFWQTFAQQLAAMHKHSQAQFGLSTNNYIGSLQQENNLCERWSEFYGNMRIMPLIKKTFDQTKLNKTEVQLAEQLCNRFADIFPAEKPALIHGDLWSGNFMCDNKGEPVIYDPAVYYGNREMDIAMSLLFGGFDKSFYNYYNETFPLQPNWEERVQLCQLYPLLVHLILFGGSYYNSVTGILKKYN